MALFTRSSYTDERSTEHTIICSVEFVWDKESGDFVRQRQTTSTFKKQGSAFVKFCVVRWVKESFIYKYCCVCVLVRACACKKKRLEILHLQTLDKCRQAVAARRVGLVSTELLPHCMRSACVYIQLMLLMKIFLRIIQCAD